MRVAMRRLRSALGLFQRAFPCSDFVVLRAEAKRIASAMGEARNWDVFAYLVRAGPLQAFPDEPGFETLLRDLARLRDESRAAVATVLAQPETTHFVLSAEAFVARRGWRNALSGDDLPRLTESASSFAAESLERLHRRVRKRAKALLELAPEERHNVRIALKKVRYAADFFADLFEHASGVRAYAQAASKLQDALGNYNDMVMATELVQRLDTKSAGAAKAAGIIMGWFGREARTNDTSLREVWRSFRRVKPFWDHDLPEPQKPAVR
jgi:CHAD domain-containing protein